MQKRPSIDTRAAPPPFSYPARFRLGEGDDYVKYGHAALDRLRCGGDACWTPQVITQTWYQAETGRIPISGAGYGGPFAGTGFDALWLDMSEIVRPTRDGIHGREPISTIVQLGARLASLCFDSRGRLADSLPPQVEIPFPVVFDPLPVRLPGKGALLAVVRAATRLRTLALLRPADYAELWEAGEDPAGWGAAIAPVLAPGDEGLLGRLAAARLVEIEAERDGDWPAAHRLAGAARSALPEAVLGWRLSLRPGVELQVEELVADGAPLVHLCADESGREHGAPSARHAADRMQEIHHRLVAAGLRDRVTLLLSGGMAAAEHVPKAMACGADAVAVDDVLLVALGCALWADVLRPCPVEDAELDAEWGEQRIVNLMAAWRDQLLEVLGAMGLREARRLRGELGRTISQPREEEGFRGLFRRVVAGHGVTLSPEAGEGELEGDLRWPTALLLATAEQASTGRPPTSGLEHRVGRSGGGFDRLRLIFEVDAGAACQQPVPEPGNTETPDSVDLTLELNRRDPGRPRIGLPHPWYGAGMSYGSVSLQTMLARARAAATLDSFTSTGEGGYPDELIPYARHIITQVATGLFGVREDTIQRARIIELKYAQGAKPGLGGHLLGSKVSQAVAAMREAMPGTSLFSPFPFHSVYSVEDHKKHLDWIRTVHPHALLSVKVSTPGDVDMVAVGSYYAGAHIVHLDGAYGGTGAAPEIAKKNIAMPLEYAIPRVHGFLEAEGIRDEVTVMASGGIRSAWDVAKAIALGADGCIVGTAELVALGCMRLGTCERVGGCPFGITTTDPQRAGLIDPVVGGERIANLYRSWRTQLAGILRRLGLSSVRHLRGRTDLLAYLE